jgi:hypothetical protein
MEQWRHSNMQHVYQTVLIESNTHVFDNKIEHLFFTSASLTTSSETNTSRVITSHHHIVVTALSTTLTTMHHHIIVLTRCIPPEICSAKMLSTATMTKELPS